MNLPHSFFYWLWDWRGSENDPTYKRHKRNYEYGISWDDYREQYGEDYMKNCLAWFEDLSSKEQYDYAQQYHSHLLREIDDMNDTVGNVIIWLDKNKEP